MSDPIHEKSPLALSLYKYEGAGNDFLVVEHGAIEGFFSEKLIQELCLRNHGLGADGVICYKNLSPHTWRMIIYNRDGTRAGMCGNALRCLAAHLWHLGLEKASHTIVSDTREHTLSLSDHSSFHNLPKPLLGSLTWATSGMGEAHEMKLNLPPTFVDLSTTSDWLDPEHVLHVDWLNTGVPHLVFVSTQKANNLIHLGQFWRWHAHFAPEGVNVSVANWDIENHLIHLSTYERGVEAPTLACGTAACAAAISYWMRHPKSMRVQVQYESQLPLLLERSEIKAVPSTSYSPFHVDLTGPARLVFEGRVLLSQ